MAFGDMSHSIIPQIVWMLASILVVSVQIISAVLLLREKHIGPWLMLAGAVINLVAALGHPFVSFFSSLAGGIDLMSTYMALSGLAYFGALLFGIGLLLHALRLKGRADRIAELEAILHSRHQQE